MQGPVAFLPQGEYLIAAVQNDLSDSELVKLRDDVAERVGRDRVSGIIIDVTALDVIDSFFARSLQSIAMIARLRGAETVIAGIRPDVAIAMVHFNLNLKPLHAALDLDEALKVLASLGRAERS